MSMERKLHCNDGHDLCYCAGRAECHNCGQPLSDSYVKTPLSKDDYNYQPEYDTADTNQLEKGTE